MFYNSKIFAGTALRLWTSIGRYLLEAEPVGFLNK